MTRESQAQGPQQRVPRVLFVSVWLFFLTPRIRPVLDSGDATVLKAVILGGLALFAAGYVAVAVLWEMGIAWRTRVTLSGLMLVAAATLVTALGADWLVLFIFVCNAAAASVRSRYGGRMVAGTVAIEAAVVVANHTSWSESVVYLLATVVTGLAMVFFGGLRQTRADLRKAKATVAKLAANEERLRLARDLHDLLGHSLTVLTVKSQLARRLVVSDPEAAIREMMEVEQVARQALADVRGSVSDYRRPTLDVEAELARGALAAGGIDASISPEIEKLSGLLPDGQEAALAWALREAVTNVVRHSKAKRCRIRLVQGADELAIEVVDSGREAPQEHHDDDPARVRFGNGLTGLRERLAMEGGRVEAHATGSGFTFRAAVPVSGVAR